MSNRQTSLGNKTVMARNILRMMEVRNVRATDVCKAINVSKSTFSAWVHAENYPRIDKIELMARFFNCTKADLVEVPGEFDHFCPATEEETEIVILFRNADEEIKSMVRRLLSYSQAEKR